MNEISDSVEMLHEKPNKGMPVFTWILVLLLAAALIWCSIGEIDYFIKASGIVRPGENVSTISSLMTGRVDMLNISEGDRVQKVDLLFKVDTEDMEQSLAALEKEKQRIETDNANLKSLTKVLKAAQIFSTGTLPRRRRITLNMRNMFPICKVFPSNTKTPPPIPAKLRTARLSRRRE